jgi:hypothetical protein
MSMIHIIFFDKMFIELERKRDMWRLKLREREREQKRAAQANLHVKNI